MTLTKSLFFSLLIYCSFAQAWQFQTGDYKSWSSNLVIADSVAAQIDLHFQNEGQLVNSPYSTAFPKAMLLKIFSEMESRMNSSDLASSICTAYTNITFPKLNFPMAIPGRELSAAKSFEKEFLRVESLDCLGEKNLNSVFSVFLSDAFQLSAINGLKDIKTDQKTNKVCHKTKIFGVGESDYCFTQNLWRDENTIVIHSFNETNKAGIEAPVFFREVVTVLKKLKNNHVVLYNLAYGRGPKLPFHPIVKGIVAQQQAALIETLVNSLP